MSIFDKKYFLSEKVFDTRKLERYNDKNIKSLNLRMYPKTSNDRGNDDYEVNRDHSKGG